MCIFLNTGLCFVTCLYMVMYLSVDLCFSVFGNVCLGGYRLFWWECARSFLGVYLCVLCLCGCICLCCIFVLVFVFFCVYGCICLCSVYVVLVPPTTVIAAASLLLRLQDGWV